MGELLFFNIGSFWIKPNPAGFMPAPSAKNDKAVKTKEFGK